MKLKTTIVEISDSELNDSDFDLNTTLDKLDRTNLSSSDDMSVHEIDTIEKKRKPVTYQKKFKIKKPDYPSILKEYIDSNGVRYYKDKANHIEVI